MGTDQSKVANDDQKQSISSLKHQKEMSCTINKECLHIRAVCDTNAILRKLQLKLAIFEQKTFKKIKYSNKCGHYEIRKQKTNEELQFVQDCKEQAPDSFPSSDVFMCTQHLKDIRMYFDCQMTKVNKIQDYVESINKNGSNFEKNIVNSMYTALKQVGYAFYNTSINDQMEQPKYYWPLLMTKLLTIIRYVKISSQFKTTQHYEMLENTLKLLILYRYVMNPNGVAVLDFIVGIMTNLSSVVSQATGQLIQALNAMIGTVSNSVIFGYGGAFVAYIANLPGAIKPSTLLRVGVVATASGVATGVGTVTTSSLAWVGTASAALVESSSLDVSNLIACFPKKKKKLAWVGISSGGSVAIGGGVILMIGGMYLLYKHTNNAPAQHVNAIANQHLNINIMVASIQELQQENDEQRLQQMLDDLENT
eukprot:472626_1